MYRFGCCIHDLVTRVFINPGVELIHCCWCQTWRRKYIVTLPFHVPVWAWLIIGWQLCYWPIRNYGRKYLPWVFMFSFHPCLQVNNKLQKDGFKWKQVGETKFTTTRKIYFLPDYHEWFYDDKSSCLPFSLRWLPNAVAPYRYTMPFIRCGHRRSLSIL